jgi:hypothetical protein
MTLFKEWKLTNSKTNRAATVDGRRESGRSRKRWIDELDLSVMEIKIGRK